MSDWFPLTDVPTLPILDLIAGRVGASLEEITAQDVYKSQANWDFIKIFRLEPSRRKELCKKLMTLVTKLAPDLKGSQSHELWSKVSSDSEWPDRVMSKKEQNKKEDKA